jgi:tetratricopeptide (TPR) repeat protein
MRVALVAALIAAAPLHGQGVDDARDSARAGKYQAAIALLTRTAPADSEWVDAQRELARVYATVGRYDDAESIARRATAARRGAAVWNTLGEVLLMRGKRALAESAFVRAGAEHAPDSLTAALNIAILHYDRGERDRAYKEFDRFIDIYNRAGPGSLSAEELVAVARAVAYLGSTNPQLFKDALKAYDRAIDNDPDDPDAKIRLGELFLNKYNFADAQRTFDDVLRVNPSSPRGLLGAARRVEADHGSGADSLLSRALAVNPNFVEARIFRAELLIDLEDYDASQKEIDRALSVNPTAERAVAVGAAIKFLTRDTRGFEAMRQRALALDPADGDLYATLAEMAAQVRLYAAAADFARQGIAADAKHWRSYGLLGMNELRMGRIAEGRKSLETAFAGDPYNVWIKNTLDLIDTYKNYDESQSEHFHFVIEKSESSLLSIYLRELAEEAYATFAARYAFMPPPPVRIEVYRSHADFSVRTVGLAGLGALGVSFGSTLAFDSPAARDAGPFNWGSTVWHELAHTFTLGMTEHRVPRWLSEGLSVYEEHHAKPGWGFGVTPEFLLAFKAGKLVPVSRMNDGFMHPAYPQQVQFSYYQASLVCDLIARDHGEGALLNMLQAYRDGMTTEQVFQRVLNTDMKSFDTKFTDYLRARFATALASLKGDQPEIDKSMSPDEMLRRANAAPGDFAVQLFAGAGLLGKSRADDAIVVLERARALFPEYGGDDSAYPLLVRAYVMKGDAQKAAEVLGRAVTLTEADYKGLLQLAELLQPLGDLRGAADALERAIYINPFDDVLHRRLAELYRGIDPKKVVRERLAVVALNPVDKSEAMYQLALAYRDAGDEPRARTSVLRALEEAPNYERAQTLLLSLYDARNGKGRKP